MRITLSLIVKKSSELPVASNTVADTVKIIDKIFFIFSGSLRGDSYTILFLTRKKMGIIIRIKAAEGYVKNRRKIKLSNSIFAR